MSNGFLASHATAALQVITLPFVAFSALRTSPETFEAMMKCVSAAVLENRSELFILSPILQNQNGRFVVAKGHCFQI